MSSGNIADRKKLRRFGLTVAIGFTTMATISERRTVPRPATTQIRMCANSGLSSDRGGGRGAQRAPVG